jgi:hypothetical protein
MSLFFISIRLMTTVLLLALICGQWMTPAWAFQEDENFTQRTPVSAAALDRMRGGFQNNPNDPIMSFGIERSVFLNGKLVSTTVLTIPNLMQLAGNPANTFTLIQTGGGNSLASAAPSLPAFMTVIQNSLDNQNIQNQTVMNATVAALSWARSLALGNALSQTTVGAIRH